MAEAFIYDHIRTPRGKGKANGSLHEIKPIDLVVGLLDEVKTRNPNLDPNRVDDVVLGVVSPVGDQGADIAKTAAIAAGYLPAIRSTNFQVRSAAEREAINMPIQGTAADIIKVAMIRVDAELRERELRSRMILQVHDELIFECPADEVDAIRELATRIMPAGLEMNVPLKVDLKQGKNWGGIA